jgi:hypothetical protein
MDKVGKEGGFELCKMGASMKHQKYPTREEREASDRLMENMRRVHAKATAVAMRLARHLAWRRAREAARSIGRYDAE